MTAARPLRHGVGRARTDRTRPRTVILVAPFGLISFPDIGSSSLKAVFARAGYALDVEYCNLDFVKRIGVKNYQFLASNCNPFLVSEYPFATDLNPELSDFRAFVRDVLPPSYGSRPGTARGMYKDILQRMAGIVAKVPGYLDDLERNLDLSGYDVIGFATSYAQNSAAWALARRLRRRYAEATFVIGGANCEGVMGQAHVDAHDFIDYACNGEGEQSFLQLVRWIDDPETNDFPRSGIVSRGHGGDPGARQLVDVGALPAPDYDDYFAALEQHPDWRKWYYGLPIESSRGCWWGQKSQCVFCGCNGTRLVYRRKPAERFLAELEEVRARYGEKAKYVQVADNIMPHEYLDTFLPLVKETRPYSALFYEIKSNLKPGEIERLRESGVTFLQPGIESLSTPVLDLMRKGVTAIANVQTLKFATENGILLIWAILCGIPDERAEHYEQMADLLPRLYHLNPPKGIFEVSIDRHSPLHQEPSRYGLRLEPARAYRHLYGLPDELLERLAYWFEDKSGGSGRTNYYDLPDYTKACKRRIQMWQAGFFRRKDVRFDYTVDGDRLVLVDTRSGVEATAVLTGLKKSVAEATRAIASFPQIRRAVRRSHPSVDDASIRDALDELVESSFLLREGGKHLFLGLNRAALQARPTSGFWIEAFINNEEYAFA